MRTALLVAAWLALPVVVGRALAFMRLRHERLYAEREARKLRRTMVAIRTHRDGLYTLSAATTEMDSGKPSATRIYGMPWYDHPKVKVPS